MSKTVLGLDIGGTKCAAVLARETNDGIELIDKVKMPTDLTIAPEEMLARLADAADAAFSDRYPVDAVGISCGGPLDSRTGVILGPPNLPGWGHVEAVKLIQARYGVPAYLQNDANACAVAEWKFGAGKGTENMLFLTFGTGLGAGLILNGRLYTGTNDNAGECGHIRLQPFGPVAYGKAGSFEGFCSGGGLAQLGWSMALEQVQMGNIPAYWHAGITPEEVTAKSIAEAAEAGDTTAREVYRVCGQHLGMGLSVLMDILNPQRIVLGSIFARSGHLLWDAAKESIEREALPMNAACCEVVPAALGEQIGDYAAVATALL
ncbi:MAG: ROK family protein [Clostridia bacterium]|nr:ROK family protein [Clostridia bacterium]